jgi:hypothetical protein
MALLGTPMKTTVTTINRFEVTLEDGRVLVLYGEGHEPPSIIPPLLPAPPAYIHLAPVPPVISVRRTGFITRTDHKVPKKAKGPAGSQTFNFGTSTAKLVEDVRKAPGT